MDMMITPEDFALAMKKTGVDEACPKITVAVSGGGDSLALAILVQEWVKARGGRMLALTVDHQLRSDSRGEAEKVQKILRARGIPQEILSWAGEKPASHVQERAREARYNLLLQACRQRDFPVLAVAHNLEDQAETFWMRLAHGSGLDGLAAMAAVRDAEGVSIIRPVLSFSREQLRTTCHHHDVDWIEDPSNQNDKYLRVRLRQFEELLGQEGLTPSRINLTIQKLEDARQALETVAAQAVASCVVLHPEGYATLKMSEWLVYPRDLQRRILGRALSMIAQHPYPVGFEAIEQTRQELHDAAFAGKSLAGCEIFPGQAGEMFVIREAAAAEGRTLVDKAGLWDGRFSISGFSEEFLEIGILGDAGLSELRKNINRAGTLEKRLNVLPFKVKRVLPALWLADNLLAVPHIGYYSQACPGGMQAGQVLFIKNR